MRKFEVNSSEKKLERFKNICKERGIKLTPQRLIIYEELISTDEHPSTDMVYQKVRKTFPTISFDTVNRTLLTFYDMGVASIVEGTGNPKRFDGNLTKHHHFQCIHCKKIIDLYSPQFDTVPIPEGIQESCTVLSKTVHLEGICETCRKDKN